ncbi:MAG: hypothetical protein SOT81_07785 [Treponema sp.]|nr:hypothetical protein [Treponema sp.]
MLKILSLFKVVENRREILIFKGNPASPSGYPPFHCFASPTSLRNAFGVATIPIAFEFNTDLPESTDVHGYFICVNHFNPFNPCLKMPHSELAQALSFRIYFGIRIF